LECRIFSPDIVDDPQLALFVRGEIQKSCVDFLVFPESFVELDVLLHVIIHVFLQLSFLCPQSIILEAGDDSGSK
jgi:hypothetical protein